VCGFDTRSILPAIRAPQADGSTGRRPHSSPARALTAPAPAQAQSRREPVHSSQPQMVFHFFTFHFFTGATRSSRPREYWNPVLNWNHQPVKPYTLALARESGGMADAQGSGPCERKLVGVQVPSLAPILWRREIASFTGAARPRFSPAPRGRVFHRRRAVAACSIGRRDRVIRALVARLFRSVAFCDIRDAAADGRRDLSIGATRFRLQLHDVAIHV